jgi:hypothetical protein
MVDQKIVYLISGANRGLGKFICPILDIFSELPVFATVPREKLSVYFRLTVYTYCVWKGLGFVKNLIKRDNAVVFAGSRNPTNAVGLQMLASDSPEKSHIVKLVSADETGNKAAIEEIKAKAGRLDVVIANAGTYS